MGLQKSITHLTILLTMIAGYCDTVTFISASEIFSAHVTGNFILFSYNLVMHAETNSWLKLLSFPVFVIGVIGGGAIASRFARVQTILMLEGIILALCGITCIVFSMFEIDIQLWTSYFIAMWVVLSMGLQNAVGKLFPASTYGPTTMMTGNVTQAALDFGKMLFNRTEYLSSKGSLSRQAITIISFLAGCVLGGITWSTVGLAALSVPGVVLIIYTCCS